VLGTVIASRLCRLSAGKMASSVLSLRRVHAIDAVSPVQALLFLEEMASIVMTPFVLYFSLPQCAPAILAFLRDFTVRVDGVGDICSMAAFDFDRHGNAKYGSPSQAPKVCS